MRMRKGMVHRDVKPGNILLDPRGNCLLADFGIAALLNEHPGSGQVGTPGYMSPEQAQSEPLDARHDLYSLAVLLYELAAGRRLFAANNRFETLRQHALTPPTPLRALDLTFPMAIDQVILRALSKQPSDRQEGAAEFVRALREADAERHARPDAPQPRRRARAKPAALTAPRAPAEASARRWKPKPAQQLRWQVILAVLAACACIATAGIGINTALKSDQILVSFWP